MPSHFMAGSITHAKLGFMENGCIMMDSKKSNVQEVACLNSTQLNSELHRIAFMFNFEVLNLEGDCKEADGYEHFWTAFCYFSYFFF